MTGSLRFRRFLTVGGDEPKSAQMRYFDLPPRAGPAPAFASQTTETIMPDNTGSSKPFLTDVKTLRARARRHLESGDVTETYKGDVSRTIEILQSVLATEIVCVL